MAIETVISVLTIEGVGHSVALDDVIAGAGIDVFDGDQTVSAITGVLPARGIEIDAVVSARELSGIASATAIDGVVTEMAVDPVVAR